MRGPRMPAFDMVLAGAKGCVRNSKTGWTQTLIISVELCAGLLEDSAALDRYVSRRLSRKREGSKK